MFVGIIKVFLL